MYSNLFVCLMGMGTTFIGLTCIILLCMLMSKILAKREKAASASPIIPQENLPDTGALIAAVSAAIAEEMGTDVKGIRIVSMKKI